MAAPACMYMKLKKTTLTELQRRVESVLPLRPNLRENSHPHLDKRMGKSSYRAKNQLEKNPFTLTLAKSQVPEFMYFG